MMISCIELLKECHSFLVISRFHVTFLNLLCLLLLLFSCLVVMMIVGGEMFFSPSLCFGFTGSHESKKKLESTELECERPKFRKKMEFNKG